MGNNEKIFLFSCFSARLFVTLTSSKLLSLGKAQINLAFRSLICNSDFVQVTLARQRKDEKLRLSLCTVLAYL